MLVAWQTDQRSKSAPVSGLLVVHTTIKVPGMVIGVVCRVAVVCQAFAWAVCDLSFFCGSSWCQKSMPHSLC